jgi:hypothetical protein
VKHAWRPPVLRRNATDRCFAGWNPFPHLFYGCFALFAIDSSCCVLRENRCRCRYRNRYRRGGTRSPILNPHHPLTHSHSHVPPHTSILPYSHTRTRCFALSGLLGRLGILFSHGAAMGWYVIALQAIVGHTIPSRLIDRIWRVAFGRQ